MAPDQSGLDWDFRSGLRAESRASKDGGRVLTEIDLLEISATSTPAHPATRVLAWKTAADFPFTAEDWQGFRQAEAKARAEHEERRRNDVELKRFIAELEADAARKEKRNRPIHVKRIEVG